MPSGIIKGVPEMGLPKMDGLYGESCKKWIIWGYPHVGKPPKEYGKANPMLKTSSILPVQSKGWVGLWHPASQCFPPQITTSDQIQDMTF